MPPTAYNTHWGMMNNEETETPKPKKPEQLKQRKVFDVTAPGKSTAASNSRGVIVGHKKKVKEDMFVDSSQAQGSMMSGNPDDEKRDLMTSSEKVSIKPISQDMEASAPPVTKKTLAAPIGATAMPREPEMPAPVPEEPEPVQTPFQEITSAPLLGDKSATPETPEPAKEAAPAAEQLTPEQVATNKAMENPPTVETPKEILEEAATDTDGKSMSGEDLLAGTHAPNLGQTIVSHHHHKTKWWEWLLIFFLIVIIALVALNFLLDAEVLTTTLDVPHTDLIK
jgi:hypothetical protein